MCGRNRHTSRQIHTQKQNTERTLRSVNKRVVLSSHFVLRKTTRDRTVALQIVTGEVTAEFKVQTNTTQRAFNTQIMEIGGGVETGNVRRERDV